MSHAKASDRWTGDESARDGEMRQNGTSFEALPAAQLTAKQLSVWSSIQRRNTSLDSPFFRPEFAMAVAECFGDVEITVVRNAGQEVGFLPFHRENGNIARPVGRLLSDFHGVVASPDVSFCPRCLLRQCGLEALHFDHQLVSQPVFAPYHWVTATSPYMDLSKGFTHYENACRRAGSAVIRQALRKRRKIEREVGPVQFVPHEYRDDVFQTLIEWKVAQYCRTGAVNCLADVRTVKTLRRIAAMQGEMFSGMLSTLYAGEHLVAIHLGLRCQGVLHAWFPTYAVELSRYSPGLILWLQLAENAESLGIDRIDLGKGDERYKQRLKTGETLLAEGSVDMRRTARRIRRTWALTRERIRTSALYRPVQRIVHGIRGWRSYDCPEISE